MISDKNFMLRTAHNNIYDKLVDEKKLFHRKHHLFIFGLVYGLLHNIKSDKSPTVDMVYLNSVKDQNTRDIIDIVYLLLSENDGKTDEKLFDEILRIADAGVERIEKIDENNTNTNFNLPNLLLEAENLWSKRASEFKNLK